jgi:hypothetical protein
MITRARLAMATGLAILVIVIVAGFVVLRDDPTSAPPRLRERIVLTDDVSSELTGAVVSLVDAAELAVSVDVDGEQICTFEVRRPRNEFATVAGDTWVVLVRRVDPELRAVDVRVDRIPDSGEADGCRTEDPGGS